jgi:pimeloyl-ACP methyl ester carboxylesterase
VTIFNFCSIIFLIVKEIYTVGKEDIEVHRLGTPGGTPVVYFHGMPASGKEAELVFGKDGQPGLDIISVTRPGYGRSSANVESTLRQITTNELEVLKRIIGDKSYHVVGSSAGAKGALDHAVVAPERVKSVTLLSAMPPMELAHASMGMPRVSRIGLSLAKILPSSLNGMLSKVLGTIVVKNAQKNPEGEILNYKKILPKGDQDMLSDPQTFGAFTDVVRDWSLPETGHGMLGDMRRIGKPWRFDPKNMTKDVEIIHGGADPVVPWSAAKALARRLPNAKTTMLEGRGHAIYGDPAVREMVLRRIDEAERKK